jgi:hypothetical protein
MITTKLFIYSYTFSLRSSKPIFGKPLIHYLKFLGIIMFKGIMLLLTCFLIVSCGGNSDSKIEEIGFKSYMYPCYGMSQRLCLIEIDDDGRFYDSIEGFNFVWGHSYNLSVIVTEIDSPPADAPSIKYELKEVTSVVEDDIGTTYEYRLVELLDKTFTKESNAYFFLGKPFDCSPDVECDTLIGLNNSGGLVNIDFEYIGNGVIMLTQWN